ncbi:ribonuclease HI [Gloeobacter kilaueensis]|uniref:Ribonuclease H n=1 Tax=Gloeobacter kilaueensis (strain ATCC BAA-2537 / CCAP 1431/1 / ULC 316 / JS1) TaxID=1183438 RepID=U5QHC7_GLOK1|nr:ribonuclease HI [Gloeobacter kilaueensis]AGY58306.1 ribonuclease H [Gloeobacter kilaueensis JS1]
MIRIVTDGACLGNPGPGGWAALILQDDQIEEYSGFEAQTTNNRMEMQAVIEGLRRVGATVPVTVISDSQYVIKGMSEWLPGWKRRQWRTAAGKPVENRDLWEALEKVAAGRVQWQHVYGHRGHAENERANDLAQAAAARRPVPPAVEPAAFATSAPRSDGITYLSLIDGQIERFSSWPACQARVQGVAKARYKKCRSPEEERTVLAEWGMASYPPEALKS